MNKKIITHNKLKLILLIVGHIAFWVLYGAVVYFQNKDRNSNYKFIYLILSLTPFIVHFYSSLTFLNKVGKPFKMAFASFSIYIILFIICCYLYATHLLPALKIDNSEYIKLPAFFYFVISGMIYYFILSLVYYSVKELLVKKRKIKILEQQKNESELEAAVLKQYELERQKEKLKLEYAFLHAQINPHFLYNTLNVLYSQAMDYSQDLAENILKLSNMMRYSLESVEFKNGKVALKKEMQYLQTLIEINNLRFGDSKNIVYQVIGDLDEQFIPPLSLITVVENAFKYGDLKDPANPLTIKLVSEQDSIYFYCRNKKRKKNIELSSHNIGISNLMQRLDISFEGKYDMKTIDENEFYTFELTIKSDK